MIVIPYIKAKAERHLSRSAFALWKKFVLVMLLLTSYVV